MRRLVNDVFIRRLGGLEVHPPEMRRGRKEFDADPLTPFACVVLIDDAALLFFLRHGVGQREDGPRVHILTKVEEASVRVDDHGLAHLAKLLAVVVLAFREHANPHKYAAAAASVGGLTFRHIGLIVAQDIHRGNNSSRGISPPRHQPPPTLHLTLTPTSPPPLQSPSPPSFYFPPC